jgi:pimeloyl-ACP methyl ester carboxylesterase
MALYAFDGTWQHDHKSPEKETNIVWFRDAYQDGEAFYAAGVGTRVGWLGAVAGAVTGVGGRKRVKEALEAFRRNQLLGDSKVDIVGFSRGAALALHFANSLPAGTCVRFLGLFDTVPSFGIPGNNIDLGWNLRLPVCAERCYHAMALNETRYNFPLHRLEPSPTLSEVWFRGVHSDVGGGNGNSGLSSITLDWMFRSAHTCGVRLKTLSVMENRARINPDAAVSSLTLTSNLHRRTPRPGDCFHPSAQH